MKTMDRRTVLRGVAGVSIALPWLEAMGVRPARAASPFPKRFIAFFTPNGNMRETFTPSGTDPSGSRILMPLAPYKDYVTVIDGLDNAAAQYKSGDIHIGDAHMRGMGTMLTCSELLPGPSKGGCEASCSGAGLAGGPSLDQWIVQKLELRAKTKFPSLELGVQLRRGGADVFGYTSFSAANTPLPPDDSPSRVFTRIFGSFTGGGVDPSAFERLRSERKSILDTAVRHYQSMSVKLGASDRQKMDAHLQGVRDLELRVNTPAAANSSKSCIKPAAPMASTDYRTVAKQQLDLLTMAIACDLTRVASFMWERAVGDTVFGWLGTTRGHHDLSHDPDSSVATVEVLNKINTWFAEQLAYLMGNLKAIPEGTGNILDNTAILWCNELSRGNNHSSFGMQYVLAGKAGGALKTNRVLKFDSKARVSHGNMLVSIMNAMDVPGTTFGNAGRFANGPLAGLS